VRLERQLVEMKSMPNEDCVSMLPDIAEWANEIVPVQHGRGSVPMFHSMDLVHLVPPTTVATT
jgi:hypothetical protein